MQVQYPILKASDDLLWIKNSFPKPILPQPKKPIKPELKTISQPQMPSKPDTSLDGGCLKYIFYFIAMGIFMIWIASNSKNGKGGEAGLFGVLILIGVVILIFSLIKGNNDDNKNYEIKLKKYYDDLRELPMLKRKMEEDYNKKILKYEEECNQYEVASKIYQEHLNEIRKPEYIKHYRRNEVIKNLNSSTKPEEKNNLIIKGVTEDYFANELRKAISLDIQQNFMLKFNNNDKGYYPDIVILDNSIGLFIDIEIDEPYIGATGEPIHFVECGDEKRDKYFKDNGWIVIRFAEEQIMKNLKKCIDFVDYVIDAILKEDSLANVSSFDDLCKEFCKNNNHFMVTKWTKSEAHKKAFARYRNTYLGFSLAEKLSTGF